MRQTKKTDENHATEIAKLSSGLLVITVCLNSSTDRLFIAEATRISFMHYFF